MHSDWSLSVKPSDWLSKSDGPSVFDSWAQRLI